MRGVIDIFKLSDLGKLCKIKLSDVTRSEHQNTSNECFDVKCSVITNVDGEYERNIHIVSVPKSMINSWNFYMTYQRVNMYIYNNFENISGVSLPDFIKNPEIEKLFKIVSKDDGCKIIPRI